MTPTPLAVGSTRSRSDTGWRRAGLLGLMLITFVWMPLGARDAGGVSSVLPALRTVSLAQPAGTTISRAATAADDLPRAPRPAPVAVTVVALLLVAALAVVELHRRPAAADVPSPVALAGLRSRAPPFVR